MAETLTSVIAKLQSRLFELKLDTYAEVFNKLSETEIYMAVASQIVPYFNEPVTYARDLYCFIEMLRVSLGVEVSKEEQDLVKKHQNEIIMYALLLKKIVE